MGGLLCLPMTTTAQGPGVQGGQWTFLGGDAWHTRYTTADQIDASNFGNLKLAWRFDARSFGPSTSRATPSYVEGRLITVTGERAGPSRISIPTSTPSARRTASA